MVTLKIRNATELWQLETSLPSIPTFSQSFDGLFGNDGIQLGAITEILGLPGAGKTQLCLQLCASVQIPTTLGGLDAEALYIDTNTNFSIFRYKEILQGCLTKCQQILGTAQEISVAEALKRLHYVNAFGLEKFCAFMHHLPRYLQDRPNIRLVAIDSITFPFKEGVSTGLRTGILFRVMARMQRAASERRVAVVLTNEMSTRLGLGSGGASVVGALGDAWAHRCNVRVLLTAAARAERGAERGDEREAERDAVLLKSNVAARRAARFRITKDGIRDV